MEASKSIAGTRRTRQYRTTAEKRLVVEATRRPGVSVATVARAHGVNANQVFYWRKLYEAGRLESTTAMSSRDVDACSVRLLPVMVDEGASQQASMIAADPIAGAVDMVTLRAVLGCFLS